MSANVVTALMSEEQIWIIAHDTTEDEPTEGSKGWGGDFVKKVAALKPQPVDTEKLKQEWNRTMRVVGQLIQQAEKEAGGSFGMQLDEVTLAVEINGKGQVTLLGACSSEASGKGAITLKFKRAESK
jgi:hypothetical protein